MNVANTLNTFSTLREGTRGKLRSAGLFLAVALTAASFVSGGVATADPAGSSDYAGTQNIYGGIAPDQIEHVSTIDRIKSVAASGSMMAIWETLEHGEKVECVDCISSVEPLLYDANPQTREIAAWWLRRRIFGVFGPGEVYQRTLQTLAGDADPVRRAYAANAIGEFLTLPGITACATAIKSDGDAGVRAAAAAALGRLNDDGAGALSQAMADADPKVRLAGVKAASIVSAFSDAAAVVRLSTDANTTVRRNAAELIGTLRAPSGVDGLLALAHDADAAVRNAACHSLGALHDARAKDVLTDLSQNDPDRLVRDQAQIALRRL